MIVPQFWAEARVQQLEPRQITVRRSGWSDISQEEAQAHAEARAREALQRIASGEALSRREPRVPYNGAEGVPIREEILERHGETIITRNVYGARCLNTPDVAFADVDQNTQWPVRGCCLLFILLFAGGLWLGWKAVKAQRVLYPALALVAAPVITGTAHRVGIGLRGGEAAIARRRIDRFRQAHPDWRIRLYRTPAGFRLLVMHAVFDPRSPEIEEFFTAIGTDPQYAAMCRAQNCFRARLSAKPWRIGMGRVLRPRRTGWPVAPEYLPERIAWVRDYEAMAPDYAACHFIDETGDGFVNAKAFAVQRVHDEECRAESGLPLA